MSILFLNGGVVFNSSSIVFTADAGECECCEEGPVVPPLCACAVGTFPTSISATFTGFANAAVDPDCEDCSALDGTYVMDIEYISSSNGCCYMTMEPVSQDPFPCGAGVGGWATAAQFIYCISNNGNGTYTHSISVTLTSRTPALIGSVSWGLWGKDIISTESGVLCNQISGVYDYFPGYDSPQSEDCEAPATITVVA